MSELSREPRVETKEGQIVLCQCSHDDEGDVVVNHIGMCTKCQRSCSHRKCAEYFYSMEPEEYEIKFEGDAEILDVPCGCS